MNLFFLRARTAVQVMTVQAIGHANKIPTMQFSSGIARDTQSKSHTLNVSGNSETMFVGYSLTCPISVVDTPS